MPLIINAVCDRCGDIIQPLEFENGDEGLADLVSALIMSGWRVEDGEHGVPGLMACPVCVGAN